ncbi:MAG: beta-ketoacyl-[acyl-carrier-protein] synthase family protein [Saprospiraceae bacterium]|nr:beta-ketoacyl-[acyl-carrier-protein] synthase family protein [Saprospiraceae bacterium]
MVKRVFVTGIGIISAIGNNLAETITYIKSSATGVGTTKYLDTAHRETFPLAEVKLTNEQLHERIKMPNPEVYSRAASLGLLAAREALASAQITDIEAHRTGLISATTVGGMDRSEPFYQNFVKKNEMEGVEVLLTHECGDSTEKIADALGIHSFVSTISTACSSSANSVMFGARLIKHGILDRAVVGGTDALTRFTLNGFNTLKILDEAFCQPFDQNRRGLNLGEGAAFLVIESEDTADKDRILAELTGYANTNDAYHQTASSPEGLGAYLAMKNALDRAQLQPSDISYINVHGTGTLNNDLSEGRAMLRLFDGNLPMFSSTKAFTGHTLGSAGSIEAVLAVLAIQKGWIYPNLRFKNPIEELAIVPVTELKQELAIEHVLSNSFGFGGNSSSLVFSKYH